MALSASTARTYSLGTDFIAPIVKSAAQIYAGGFTAMGQPNHGTAGNKGTAFPWTGAAFEQPMGWADQATLGDGTVTGKIRTGNGYVEIAVTGASSAAVANTKLVYATADGTFTLTAPAAPNVIPIGWVIKWLSGTTCRVGRFSNSQLQLPDASSYDVWTMGVGGPSGANSGGAADVLKGLIAPCHALIAATFAICVTSPTDADFAGVVTYEIGGTNVTGGDITLATADTVGLRLDGTAVTAANEMHAGDAVDIEVTAGTAGTAADPGVYNFYAVLTKLPGL